MGRAASDVRRAWGTSSVLACVCLLATIAHGRLNRGSGRAGAEGVPAGVEDGYDGNLGHPLMRTDGEGRLEASGGEDGAVGGGGGRRALLASSSYGKMGSRRRSRTSSGGGYGGGGGGGMDGSGGGVVSMPPGQGGIFKSRSSRSGSMRLSSSSGLGRASRREKSYVSGGQDDPMAALGKFMGSKSKRSSKSRSSKSKRSSGGDDDDSDSYRSSSSKSRSSKSKGSSSKWAGGGGSTGGDDEGPSSSSSKTKLSSSKSSKGYQGKLKGYGKSSSSMGGGVAEGTNTLGNTVKKSTKSFTISSLRSYTGNSPEKFKRAWSSIPHYANPPIVSKRTVHQSSVPPARCSGSRAEFRDEPPNVKEAPSLKCRRSYRDDPAVAILLYNPPSPSKVAEVVRPLPPGTEVVVFLEARKSGVWDAADFRTWADVLSGENHFIVYSRTKVGAARAYRRMLRFSNAKLVAMLGSGAGVDLGWMQRAVTLFNAVPSMGGLGGGAGVESRTVIVGHGAAAIESKQSGSPLRFVERLVAGGPVMVRRTAALEVGAFNSGRVCPGTCDPNLEGDLSQKLWKGGWSVAVHPAAAPSRECLCGATDAAGAVDVARKEAASAPGSKVSMMNAAVGSSSAGGPAGCPSKSSKAKSSDSEGGSCKSYDDRPDFAVVVQYFKRPGVIRELMEGLKKSVKVTYEVLINNDSGGDVEKWTGVLAGSNHFMVYAHDLHEIRAYNRLGKFASAKYLAFLQDDDVPRNPAWMYEARSLFDAHKGLGMLGGYRGRQDTGDLFNVRTSQVEGVKYGPGFKKMTHVCPTTKLPFMFMYKINAAPMIVKRAVFTSLGMFSRRFSCPGEAGIGFDFEFSARVWYYGKQVGLYYSQFRHHAGDSVKSGTRSDTTKWVLRKMRERDNNLNLYDLYPGFHPDQGTRMALSAQKKLKEATGKFHYEESTYFKPGDIVRQGSKPI